MNFELNRVTVTVVTVIFRMVVYELMKPTANYMNFELNRVTVTVVTVIFRMVVYELMKPTANYEF